MSPKWSSYWDNVSRAKFGSLPWRSRSQHDLAAKSCPAHNFIFWSWISKLFHRNDHHKDVMKYLACVQNLFVEHHLVRQALVTYTSSPQKPLIGFWPNFTGMMPGLSPTKVIQNVPIGCISRSWGNKKVLKMQFSKILSETTSHKAFMFSILHHLEVLHQICLNYAPWFKTDPARGSQFLNHKARVCNMIYWFSTKTVRIMPLGSSVLHRVIYM